MNNEMESICKKIKKNSWRHLRIRGAKMAAQNMCHTEDPKVLGATLQNLLARATWRPGFVRLWISVPFLIVSWGAENLTPFRTAQLIKYWI